MAINTRLSYGKLDEFILDPQNPRLGRKHLGTELSQDEILDLMKDWSLDELALSYLESGGFWTQEALLATKEIHYKSEKLVVIEGNRRLAALILLSNAFEGKPDTKKWEYIVQSQTSPSDLFTKIPYILVDSREDIESFLGFRHVTGIKQWNPAEKAQFIARLIDSRKLDYNQVRRKIGSKLPTVRQNYISYRLLLQMEDDIGFTSEKVEERFSVMYLSLRTKGVQKYQFVDIFEHPLFLMINT